MLKAAENVKSVSCNAPVMFLGKFGPELSEALIAGRRTDPLPVVLIGTTAGTGSEVSSVAVLTDSTGRQHAIHDPRLSDARSLPRNVTLPAGIDVIAHCVENALSRKAVRLSILLTSQGVRLAFPVLCAAASDRKKANE